MHNFIMFAHEEWQDAVILALVAERIAGLCKRLGRARRTDGHQLRTGANR